MPEADSPGATLRAGDTAVAPTTAAAAVPASAAPVAEASVAGVDENAPPLVVADEDEATPFEEAATRGVGDSATTTTSAAAPTRRHRVKVAARDAVEGKIAPRVEKLRQASTVVLDEAAEDPGLRFVLVAAVLVILSLVLLLLSQILG
jgi:hypothetical protein